MNDKIKLPLRIGVGVVLLNHENKVFVGKRIDNPQNFWQMPQGGVDKNENLLNAAKRELKEETSIKSVELIKEVSEWLEYNLPKNLLGKIWQVCFIELSDPCNDCARREPPRRSAWPRPP